MKYKIIVDKQSRLNPSTEKKEYEIEIEELRTNGKISDSLIITPDESYVLRKLSLSEFQVLNVLDNPIKEVIKDLNIELFEGNNYIYLIDVKGNKFYAEYLIDNDFTNTYVTTNEMTSAINQSSQVIELKVNQKLTDYATTEEMNSAIKISADGINSEVSKKVGKDEIISKINQSAEAVTIEAKKININGTVSANGNFKVDTNGNMECSNGKFTGGKIELTGGTQSNPNFLIKKDSNNAIILPDRMHLYNNGNGQVLNYVDDIGGGITIGGNAMNDITLRGGSTTEICCYGEIKGKTITQMSLESIKKNFEKIENAVDIVKNSEIYKYNLKSEEDTDKKHYGFVIGKNYNTPNEVISKNGDSIDTYSMISILWKAVQEQQAQIEALNKEIKEIKENGKN